MKYLPSFRSLLLAAAVSLGLASLAGAADGASAASTAKLLGTRYAGVSVGYVDISGTGFDARNYGVEYNHVLASNLDLRLEADYLRSEGLGGALLRGRHYSFRTLSAVGRTHTDWRGAKVYAEAGAGHSWFKSPLDFDDSSWLWLAGVGAEIAVTQSLTLTPFLRYQDATNFSDGDALNYGTRAHYALNARFGLTGEVKRDDEKNVTYALGAALRF